MATVTEEIDLPVNTNADEAANDFKGLSKEIRAATIALQALEKAGITSGDAFDEARARLDNLNDTLERSRFRAGQFDDRLSAMPGVLGQAGSALKQFNDSVNMFGKTLTYSLGVVGIIVAAFMAMKKALESTAEGQATLNRISTAFQKILGPILAIIEAVALPLFEGLASVLEKVGVTFAFVAEKLGISKQKIAEASSGNKDFAKTAEEAAKAAKDAADKAAAEAEKAAAEAKARREKYAAELLKSNEIIFQARIALMSKKDAELEVAAKKHEENLIQLRKTGGKGINIETERYLKERKEIEDKYFEEARKSVIAQVKSTLDTTIAVNEAEIAARKKRGELTMLDELQFTGEIFDIKIEAQKILNKEEDRLAKEQLDTGKITNLQYLALKKQNDAEILLLEKQKSDKLYDITSEAYKKESELIDFINIDKLNKEIEALDREQALKEFDFDDDIKREELKLAKQKEIYDAQVALLKDNTAEKIKLDNEYAKNKRETEKRITDIEKSEREYRFQIYSKYAELAGQIGRLLSQAAGDNKDLALAGLAIESASAAAIIGINAYKNASKAGFLTPLGIAEIIAGAAGIAAVYLNYNKGKAEIEKIPTPGGGSGGGASAPSLSPPTITAPEVNLFTATQQGTTAGIIAGTISSNNSADRPMKVYVTSNDITSTQELDRKALNLARL
jgi:hypothetical protein